MNANVKKGTLLSVFGALLALIGVAGVSALNGEFSNTDKWSNYRCTYGDHGYGYGYGYDCVRKPHRSTGGGGSSSTSTSVPASTTGNQNTGSVNTGVVNTGVVAVNTLTGDLFSGVSLTGTLPEVTVKFTETSEGKVAVESLRTSTYPSEWNNAYLFARSMGITTMPTLQSAMMEKGLTRAELAKILSVFTQKFTDKKVIENKVGCEFADKAEAAGDLANYMNLACKLEIMGLHADGKTPLTNFMPNKFVSRAELATVFSRVLNGNQYDNNDGNAYWTKHIEVLKGAGILADTTPTLQEVRANIFLMIYRTKGK